MAGKRGENLEDGAFNLWDAGDELYIAELTVHGVAQGGRKLLDEVYKFVRGAEVVDHPILVAGGSFAAGDGADDIYGAPDTDALDKRCSKVIFGFLGHRGKYYSKFK